MWALTESWVRPVSEVDPGRFRARCANSGPRETSVGLRDEGERLRVSVDGTEGDREESIPTDPLTAGRADNENGRRLWRNRGSEVLLPPPERTQRGARQASLSVGGQRRGQTARCRARDCLACAWRDIETGMGWAGRKGRPGLCGTEVGRAEQSRVLGVPLARVCGEQPAWGRGGLATSLPADGTGPPGFEPGFEAPEAPVISKLYYGPALGALRQRHGGKGLSVETRPHARSSYSTVRVSGARSVIGLLYRAPTPGNRR
jgi:hypothetical protein